MRRLRFSLFDLFVVTLGVAAGLAYHRVPDVGWSDALLVMCATWIVVGMVEQSRSAYVTWRVVPRADRELRNGAALAMARPLAVVAMLAAAVGLEIAKEFELDVSESIALDAFTASLFSLAIICAYTAPGRATISNAPPRNPVVQSAVGFLALVLGGIWLVYVLISAETISGLVHLAIRGVEVYQPTRWGGKPFHPFDPQTKLLADFFRGAIVAAAAVALSAISTFLLTVYWNRRFTRRWLIGIATAGIVCAAYLVHWYWTVGFPSVSPYLAANTGTQPWYVVAAGISVFAGACFLFAMRYVPEPRLSDAIGLETTRPYHLSGVVMSLLLLAMVITALPGWWNVPFINSLWGSPTLLSDLELWWSGGAGLLELPWLLLQIVFALATAYVEEPKMLLRLAAILVVCSQLLRWRRGEVAVETLAPVQSAKLVTVTALAAVTLLLAIPAGAWLGFVIVITPIGGM
ncbi:MAG TPA: hypothetical protein VGI40_01085 [Pirellulaceae bacterium]|jgi:hypothetical protein